MIMVDELLKQAEQGKAVWEEIDKKFDSEQYFLFPHENDEYNFYALLYFDHFMMINKLDKAIVLCYENVLEKVIPLFTKKNVTVCVLKKDDIESIVRYYGFFEFTTRLKIISLTKPYDTYGENLLGIKNVTKEDLLCYDIYRFDNIPKVEVPTYFGQDSEIVDFLKLGIKSYIRDLEEKNKLMDKRMNISRQWGCYVSMLRWMTNKNNGKLLKNYFNDYPYKKVAIYGADEIGRLVYHELRDAKCEVKCFIGRDAEGISWYMDVEVIMERELADYEKLDAIIVPPLHDYVEISERLSKNGINIPTLSLRDVIFEL